MARYDMWFDPNDVGPDLTVECLISDGPRAGDPAFDPEVGDVVLVGHDEGERRRGRVIGRRGDHVWVQLELGGATAGVGPYDGGMTPPDRPSDEELQQAASLLGDLAGRHGLANLRLGDPGQLVVDVAEDRTYFDVVAFEDAVEATLGWRPDVIPSGAEAPNPRGPVTGASSAA